MCPVSDSHCPCNVDRPPRVRCRMETREASSSRTCSPPKSPHPGSQGFSWSALDIVTCSDLESGEDRGARGEIRLPAALAGSQKRGARAGETGFWEGATASVAWGVALQHASFCARRSVRSCRCPLRHRRGWDEKREMDQTQLLQPAAVESLCCALTEAGGVGGFGQAAGHARGPSRPFS